jgi:hypothetical protein
MIVSRSGFDGVRMDTPLPDAVTSSPTLDSRAKSS